MAKYIFSIQRQENFILNPDDRIVNGVIKGLNRCGGKCPCYHPTEGEEAIADADLMCPCKEYRENKHCRCNLYVKDESTSKSSELEELGIKFNAVCAELANAKAELDTLNSSSKTYTKLVY